MKYCGIPDHLMWPMILEELDASYYGRMAEMLDLPLEEIICEAADECTGSDEGEADFGSEKGLDRKAQSVLSRQAVADLSEALEFLHWHEYDEYIEKNGVRGFPGVKECLAELRLHRIRLAVATGSLERIVRKNLKLLEIEDLIEEIVTSEDCEKGKPDPDIFLLAAERLGVEPGECLVVEDSENGVIAAERAGMSRVGFEGAEMSAGIGRIAPFVFSDYRELNSNSFYLWYIRSQKDWKL